MLIGMKLLCSPSDSTNPRETPSTLDAEAEEPAVTFDDLSTMDYSTLVRIRAAHETKEARLGIRNRHGHAANNQETRSKKTSQHILLSTFHGICKEEAARSSFVPSKDRMKVPARLNWVDDVLEAEEKLSGNAKNAADARELRVTKVSQPCYSPQSSSYGSYRPAQNGTQSTLTSTSSVRLAMPTFPQLSHSHAVDSCSFGTMGPSRWQVVSYSSCHLLTY